MENNGELNFREKGKITSIVDQTDAKLMIWDKNWILRTSPNLSIKDWFENFVNDIIKKSVTRKIFSLTTQETFLVLQRTNLIELFLDEIKKSKILQFIKQRLFLLVTSTRLIGWEQRVNKYKKKLNSMNLLRLNNYSK